MIEGRVRVHRNHNNFFPSPCWSVLRRGRLIHRLSSLVLIDVEFRIQQAGRMRALREGKRNTHAYAKGEHLIFPVGLTERMESGQAIRVVYDPFKHESFVIKDTGEPVDEAARCYFDPYGRMFIY